MADSQSRQVRTDLAEWLSWRIRVAKERAPAADFIGDDDATEMLADRIAELERDRADRDEKLAAATRGWNQLLNALGEIFPAEPAPPDDDCCDEDDPICGKCGALCSVDDGCEFDPGDPCHHCAQDAYSEARALVARLTGSTAGKEKDRG